MNKKTSITLKDIAKESGYSLYTVSRALNGKDDISDKTKEEIQKVAEKLGYVQNTLARNLRLGSSRTIALIYDDFTNPYYSVLIKNISILLKEEGYDTTLFYDFDSISKLHIRLMQRVISANVDGIISFIEITEAAAQIAKNAGKPLVQIGSKSHTDGVSCIYVDDHEGGKLATNYLIKKGNKRISFISSDPEHNSAVQRLEAYKQCLTENNLPIDPSLIITLADEHLEPSEALSILLNNHTDAIIAFNDYTAYVIKRQLLSMNMNDIEVVGFDNIATYFPMPVSIPSVSGNVQLISKIAAETIVKGVNGTLTNSIDKKVPVKIN